jgi:hypothetical protein
MRPWTVFLGSLGLAVVLGASCDGGDEKATDGDTPVDTEETPADTDETPADTDETPADTPTDTDTPADTDTTVETDTPLDTDTTLGDSADSAAVESGTPGDTGVLPPPDPPDSGATDTGGGAPPDPCGPVDVPDCNGDCANPLLLQDDVCHDGRAAGMADFDCAEFNFDEGACIEDTDAQPCPDPLDVRDCVGRCYPETWVGDGQCDDGTTYPHGDPNFACAEFQDDGGDCIPLVP